VHYGEFSPRIRRPVLECLRLIFTKCRHKKKKTGAIIPVGLRDVDKDSVNITLNVSEYHATFKTVL
jgi:hypothetical protein